MFRRCSETPGKGTDVHTNYVRWKMDLDTATRSKCLLRLTLGKHGISVVSPIAKNMRGILQHSVLAFMNDCIVISCSAPFGMAFLKIKWQLFDSFEYLSDDESILPIMFNNTIHQRPGDLLDFLWDSKKKTVGIPTLATFTISESFKSDETRAVLRLKVCREIEESASCPQNTEISTKFKYSSSDGPPIYLPRSDKACRASLEQYSFNEITKWLSKIPKDNSITVTLTREYVTFSSAEDEQRLTFNAKWFGDQTSIVSSASILSQLCGHEPAPKKRELSSRAIGKKLKEARIIAVHGDKDACPIVVSLSRPGSLKQSLGWLKSGPWGPPCLTFYKDSVNSLGVELSERGGEELAAGIFFLSAFSADGAISEQCHDDSDTAMHEFLAEEERLIQQTTLSHSNSSKKRSLENYEDTDISPSHHPQKRGKLKNGSLARKN
ncbi:DNA polymerase processivity subunit [Gallid alphaherpesvirus 1]|uniref:DNA polymerase processivity subunit n=1 Tax=Infectious laryngotracheitis virus TaxID=10386 RepID=G8HKE0_ILTV|nr:DNA polymerase processivity subunit [Gallid alphaherpesvirus 1]AER28067.1 DNA polymerase processivity subunit [Gallid alphaherpesvirus 1]AER28146.1 DNA polymerase processivity subunit [Gallid alphaherpesvirus 1]AFD36504.1 UL42 protein [Gallid alphaherpesvirus 1]AFN02023.1 DNA polymerase processivity subunit [Gallid alphaherpesvirus 1]AGC23072.1 DNA polymerase processivity subunit [Gallid alphaherpesvirus 1]